MRKAAVTSSQLTESLCRPDKGLKSSWWSQALVGRGGARVSERVSERVCVCVCVFVGT